MLHKTNGIVLRSVKYGETSLIVTVFTEQFGAQPYILQGVRSGNRNKAAYFQPGMLLDLVVYMQQQKDLQRIKEFQAAHIYRLVHDNVTRNSILIFSTEVLLRLLPERAPLPELFQFAYHYFCHLDELPAPYIANLPLYFLVKCGQLLGFELLGRYTQDTPFLDLEYGGFSAAPPQAGSLVTSNDTQLLSVILDAEVYNEIATLPMLGEERFRLLDWYIAFLQLHTQHFGNIRSLPILRAILH